MDEAKDRFGDYLLGYNESEYFRGLFLYRGICGPKNYEEAAKCFLKVVKAGDGNVLIPGGLSDGDRSRYWRKFQSSARYHLGFMYYHGQGVSQNYAEAFKFLIQAAFGDCPEDVVSYLDNCDVEYNVECQMYHMPDAVYEALDLLGNAYRDGLGGVKQDYQDAICCYKRGTDSSHKSLGDMYRDGLSVAQDYSKAAENYKRAASSNADAMDSLADLYRNGQGVAKDPAEAMKWYMKAAQNGSADAKKKIMEMMGGFAGTGISPDSAQKEITG